MKIKRQAREEQWFWESADCQSGKAFLIYTNVNGCLRLLADVYAIFAGTNAGDIIPEISCAESEYEYERTVATIING
eukprot:scaffold304755_cov26-Prasinocladus_malaysianus.AAC.1